MSSGGTHILGHVSSHFDPLVHLDLRLDDGSWHSLKVVVDTGFTGWLTLSANLARRLKVPYEGRGQMELANGTFVSVNRYEATVKWFDQDRQVLVDEADGAPMIGMRMLQGSILTLDARRGGVVQIVPVDL